MDYRSKTLEAAYTEVREAEHYLPKMVVYRKNDKWAVLNNKTDKGKSIEKIIRVHHY